MESIVHTMKERCTYLGYWFIAIKGMLKKFLSLFKPTFDLKLDHEVELVFTSGGVDYYKFVNEFNIPYSRAMAALDIQKELEERTDVKYHKTCYASIIEHLRLGKMDLAAIECHNALERMENISNVDLMYKLASVLYFDKKENPYSYDYEYADKKIKAWKKNSDIEDFFLRTPLAEYLPSFDGLPMSITEYTREQRKELLRIIKNRLSQLSGKSKNQELLQTLSLHVKELEELLMNS
jgi:hypothetical protein